MMSESQNIEYKQSWHEDYLKWICGFANAQGGIIFIGKDDNGNILGIENYKRLMDDIPNKVRNVMGITIEVNLHKVNKRYFIEIVTLHILFLFLYVEDITTEAEALNRN